MRNTFFYLGIALLFTHELDAMSNQEWTVLPLVSSLSDTVGEFVFVLAHVPLFALVIALIASLDPSIRSRARATACGFLVLHALLHLAFSGHESYEFSSLLSSVLIYGAAFCGVAYLLLRPADRGGDAA